ncbi:MAG: hypothetical protein Q8O51_00430 [bacterium]|nr:hypothetical protein [bacterium]
MSSDMKSIVQDALTWVLYASAGFGAFAYALFLRTKRALRTFEEAHGLVGSNPANFNPRDVFLRKLHGIEALRGLAIVVMLIGFLFWPVLFIGVLLFFFQTNAWKSTQRDLFVLDRDQPEYKQARQKQTDALDEPAKALRQSLERRGSMWQRVFAITMGIALLFAVALLVLLMTGSSTSVKS